MVTNQPLANRMRPAGLEGYAGQEKLVGKDGIIRRMIESGNVSSFILWGPPGVGKTTLAKILANKLNRPFYNLSAVNSGVKDVRETIEKARKQKFFNTPSPILFIDEIHRFSKSQQDSLLGAVEQGIVTLIGATTENPSFEVISPLLSRCQVYTLEPLGKDQLDYLLQKALNEDFHLKKLNIEIKEKEALFQFSGGDARKLMNALELVVNTKLTGNPDIVIIDNENVKSIIQENLAIYDKNGEMHYDIISAFVKSVRGSDPDAAVYWLARMIEGGEDARFIARRLVILAAEDIGLANPNALLIANNRFQAVHTVGWPESRIILSEATIYLAASPKSNSAYEAINRAQDIVAKTGNLPVPLHIRNAPTKLMKDLGYGKEYKYAHSYEGNFVQDNFFPEELKDKKLWQPGKNSREKELKDRLNKLWNNRYK
ncbi:MAG: replication-associated recombination protein A [Bacteroidota bacterium]